MVLLSNLTERSFDYVVVGGGTAGCLVAASLASRLPLCKILVVEAGKEDADDLDNLIPGLTKPKFGSADGNWLYETKTQRLLGGRTIVYPRGRGLGGCSSNNFMAWVKGPGADYDSWADEVDDPWWGWKNVKEVLKSLEKFNPECPPGMEHYAVPTPNAHGYDGPIGVQYGPQWQPLISYCLEASEQAGHPLNTDHNDGDPVGYSVAQFNVSNATRITSPGAFLNSGQRSRLSNLVVLTQALCSRIVFDGKRAVGVEIVSFSNTARNEQPIRIEVGKEVILTAGTFQSAQLLLLSGIGPKEDLQALGISSVVDSPNVGQNIQDHSALACEFIVSPNIEGHNQVLNSDELLSRAQKEYKETRSGPLAVFGASACLIFPRLPSIFNSSEKKALDTKTQAFLNEPTRPSTEIWMHSGPLFYTGPCPPDASVLVIEGLNQNCLSKGNMTLRSTDPRQPPVIDLQYLAHPYDIRVAVETVREIVKLSRTPALEKIIEKPLLAPADDSDKGLETFVRQNLTQGFHGMGTCVMGGPDATNRVVNNDFSVVGCSGLRVADMSVCPILTCNHTQVNAYLIAIRCADLIVQGALRRSRACKM